MLVKLVKYAGWILDKDNEYIECVMYSTVPGIRFDIDGSRDTFELSVVKSNNAGLKIAIDLIVEKVENENRVDEYLELGDRLPINSLFGTELVLMSAIRPCSLIDELALALSVRMVENNAPAPTLIANVVRSCALEMLNRPDDYGGKEEWGGLAQYAKIVGLQSSVEVKKRVSFEHLSVTELLKLMKENKHGH